MYDSFHGMWGMHVGWWVFWIILIALGIWFITSARMRVPSSPPGREESPLEALKRRYANGEISTEEYEERKARLED